MYLVLGFVCGLLNYLETVYFALVFIWQYTELSEIAVLGFVGGVLNHLYTVLSFRCYLWCTDHMSREVE